MIKKYFLKIKYLFNKYEINLISASTSFYMIVAIFSLLILLIQLHNYISKENNFLINYIIEVLNPYYIESFEKIIPIFSLNSFSPILFINLIWSSSKFINGFNKASDIIYQFNKRRNFIVNRISSIFIFIMIISILFIEIITVLFANEIIKYIIKNMFFYSFLQFIIELFLIYSVILIINKFVPPIKIKIKDIYIGTFISTILIYISLLIFLLFIKLFQKININFSVLTIISLFFILIYVVNICLIIGIYINYYLQKNPNFKLFKRE